ncbi:MAG: hypothetical protein NTV82_02635, partial [Candidatus Aminicenantes bacterium]|nr:hypothetical protein [Candidatus Aminicenantes bacterium]
MRRIWLGLSLAVLLLGGASALTSRRPQSQADQPVPLDDSYWTGTITIESSQKGRGLPGGGLLTGSRESEENEVITFTLDQVPRLNDADQWENDKVPFVIKGSRHILEVIPPDGNYKGCRKQMRSTKSGSGTATINLTPEADDEGKPVKIRLWISPNPDDENVTQKSSWVTTTEEGTKTQNDETKAGAVGNREVVVPYDPDQRNLSGEKTKNHTLEKQNGENLPGVYNEIIRYDLTLHRPSDLDAVIIPFPGFESWMPEGGKDEDTQAGIPVVVEAELRLKSGKKTSEKAKFKFELIDTSKEPGLCLNAPKKDEAKRSYDLKFRKDENRDLIVSDDGQTARSKEYLDYETVVVRSYDWGAYGKLKVTAILRRGKQVVAHLEGKPAKKEMVIPADENNNRIADQWEKDQGVFDQNYPANWDGAKEPEGQKAPGDGISLYEKYRGFEFEGIHEQLDPNQKYLFVHDPDEIVRRIARDQRVQGTSFESVSQLRLRYVDDDHWTGLGSSSEDKRIVNFNTGWKEGHAVDQHALSVEFDEGRWVPGTIPQGWDEFLKRAGKSAKIYSSGQEGFAFPDLIGGFGSPRRTYQIMLFEEIIQDKAKSYIFLACPKIFDFITLRNNKNANPDDYAKLGEEIVAWVANEVKTHPKENEEAIARWTALVLAHEMSHAVGVEHHDPPESGRVACVIGKGFPEALFVPDPIKVVSNDHFLLKLPLPNEICRDRCWSRI